MSSGGYPTGLRVIDTIRPQNDADFPIVVEADLQGSYRTVNSVTDRDAITAAHRSVGMLVYTVIEGQFWLLTIDLVTWVDVTVTLFAGINGADITGTLDLLQVQNLRGLRWVNKSTPTGPGGSGAPIVVQQKLGTHPFKIATVPTSLGFSGDMAISATGSTNEEKYIFSARLRNPQPGDPVSTPFDYNFFWNWPFNGGLLGDIVFDANEVIWAAGQTGGGGDPTTPLIKFVGNKMGFGPGQGWQTVSLPGCNQILQGTLTSDPTDSLIFCAGADTLLSGQNVIYQLTINDDPPIVTVGSSITDILTITGMIYGGGYLWVMGTFTSLGGNGGVIRVNPLTLAAVGVAVASSTTAAPLHGAYDTIHDKLYVTFGNSTAVDRFDHTTGARDATVNAGVNDTDLEDLVFVDNANGGAGPNLQILSRDATSHAYTRIVRIECTTTPTFTSSTDYASYTDFLGGIAYITFGSLGGAHRYVVATCVDEDSLLIINTGGVQKVSLAKLQAVALTGSLPYDDTLAVSEPAYGATTTQEALDAIKNLLAPGGTSLVGDKTLRVVGVAGNQTAPDSTWVAIGSFCYDNTEVSQMLGSTLRTTVFTAVLETTTGFTAEARLYNVTDASVISGSTINTGATTSTRVVSSTLTVPASGTKVYEVQLHLVGSSPSPTDIAICRWAGLEIHF
jgi:hypothetical protein